MATRFYDRGLFWLAVIAVAVAGALTASHVFEEGTDTIDDAPSAPEAFCAEARRVAELGDATAAAGVGDDAVLVRLRDGYLTLQPLASGPVVDDLGRLAGGLDPVVVATEAAPSGDPEAATELAGLLEGWSTATADDASRVRAYVQRWCGFDLSGEPPSVPPAGAGGD